MPGETLARIRGVTDSLKKGVETMRQEALDREKLAAENALRRHPKPPFLDFVNDLVHRPPNTEQMRQLKELLLKVQQSIAQLIAIIDKRLE